MTTHHITTALRAAHAAKAEAIASHRSTGGLTAAIEALESARITAEWEERERGKARTPAAMATAADVRAAKAAMPARPVRAK